MLEDDAVLAVVLPNPNPNPHPHLTLTLTLTLTMTLTLTRASVPSLLEPDRAVCSSVEVSEEGPFFYESVKLALPYPYPCP